MINLSIKKKLIIVVLIPLSVLLVSSMLTILEKEKKVEKLERIQNALQYSQEIGKIIHELQVERGLSSAYIGSDGLKFHDNLIQERKRVDTELKKLPKSLQQYKDLHQYIAPLTLMDFSTLETIRQNVDRLNYSSLNSIHHYNTLIKKSLDIISEISLLSSDFKLSQLLYSYINFMQAKEYTGIKRALISSAFGENEYKPEDLSEFYTYNTLYTTSIANFQHYAYPANKQYFLHLEKSRLYKKVENFESFIDVKMKKNNLLSKMKELSGYGGLIHDFKNYLLRGDEKYFTRFQNHYIQFIKLIQQYKQLKVSRTEISYLTQIQTTFAQYKENLEYIHTLDKKPTVMLLDKQVKIDDTQAIYAFKVLSENIIGVNIKEWFFASTAWINNLYTLENRILLKLHQNISTLENTTNDSLNILKFSMSLMFLLVVLLSIGLYKNISYKLFLIERGLIRFLDYLTNKTNKYELLQIEGKDEFAHLAASINTNMKSTAVHIEKEVAKRTIELQNATNAKSEFLANMSHEIRTPLNAIVGFIDRLYKYETAEEKRLQLKTVKNAASSLLSVINDILDFSKIEQHKLLIENHPFEIQETFSLVVELFFSKAKERQISIKLHIDEDLPQRTQGDTTRIKQVLSNLLSNAIKFSDMQDTIFVNVVYLQAENAYKCEVIDQGIGIAENKLKNIFNSFEQEDSSTTRKYGGTGLGLSISKELIGLMGGTLEVTSGIGKGSNFYFTLPLQSIIEEKKITPKEDTLTLDTSKYLLIVEDNKTNQMLLGMLLEDLELKYDVAENGLKAVEAVEQRNYDLILMDENMPVMNGTEATAIIREHENGSQTPIIAVTANALKGDKEIFLSAGMNDYLSKPIDANELERLLKKYLYL